MKKKLCLYFGGIIIIFCWILPVVSLPFAAVLPVLQVLSLGERFLLSLLASVVGIGCCYLGATKQRRSASMASFRSWRDVVTVFFAFIGFSFLAADLSANSVGLLAWLAPGENYSSKFSVLSAHYSSKRNTLDLELRDISDGSLAELKLSKALVAIQRVEEGNVISLAGKKNLFGIYIERPTIVGKDE